MSSNKLIRIYQREGRRGWYYSFTAPNKQRIRKFAETEDEQQARALAVKHYNALFDQSKLGVKPEYTWPETVVEWFKENPHKQQDDNTLYFLRWLDTYLGHLKIHEIDRTVIRQIRDAKAAEGVKPRTINAYLQQVRIVLRAAASWDWIHKAPDIRLLPEPKRRERWLTEDEKERLFDELPEHLRHIVRFALATGLRMSNVTQLEWAQVDLAKRTAWIHADQAKSNKPIGIPLNSEAMNVLLTLINKHQVYVFTYKGKPIKRANQRAWQNARKRAGLEDFRFHDMRHTWATNHTMAGTPLHQLKEMGGWNDLEMVQKYAHMNVEHLRQFAENSMSFDTSVTPNDKK